MTYVLMTILILSVFNILIYPSEPFLALRKMFNYLEVLVIPISVYNLLLSTRIQEEKLIKFVILIWLFVGVIQTVFNPFFLKEIISNMRTDSRRGVCSMASEPSFYGYMMIYLAICAEKFQANKRFYQFLCAFQIFFFAQSSVSIIYIAIYVALYLIEGIYRAIIYNGKYVVKIIFIVMVMLLCLFCLFFILEKYFKGTRIFTVLIKTIPKIRNVKNIEDIYLLDRSIGARAISIFDAIQESLKNMLLPHGVVYHDDTVRFLSGYGTVLYEVGWIGLYIIINIAIIFYKGFNHNFVIAVGVSIMMFSAIQFGNPLFAYMIGACLYQIRKQKVILSSD